MIRRLALLLIAFCLILGPPSGPAMASHDHASVPVAVHHAVHDGADLSHHCDDPAPTAAKSGDCAACPCAVGLAAAAPVSHGAPVHFAAESATAGLIDLPSGLSAPPTLRPPRA
ncbi:MAG TPA: hypothetical protein VK196_07295 [Magnetospirillum sp.]|nr:hypothetical protein [Magnetospirillum sp.]